eukprot:scaffold339686_cov47-Attheya_sp.AAC.1
MEASHKDLRSLIITIYRIPRTTRWKTLLGRQEGKVHPPDILAHPMKGKPTQNKFIQATVH